MTVERNSNIIKDPKIKRLVDYSEDSKQINILDQRFYKRDGKYYPSVSSILQYYPKGYFFEEWLKSNGFNSEVIASKAAFEGNQVHSAVDDFVNGLEIQWLDNYGSALYSLEVWKMILKFSDFWNRYKPELIASEYHLFSDEHQFAGTIDQVIRLREKLWLIDIKTSNSLHISQELQLAAYVKAWNEMHDEKIEKAGILWLKASTHKEDKKGEKIQGSGWQLKPVEELDKNFDIFCKVQDIYYLENPDRVPVTEILPVSIKLI